MGSPGGVFYLYGHALAMLLTKYVGVTFTDQASQGSALNVQLLEQRKAMLGFVTMRTALQGWNGTDWAKGTQYRSMAMGRLGRHPDSQRGGCLTLPPARGP
jgi:TRAP-type uncharacterized transport system substrate-binding protein